jgi:DNA polymerase-3 subunit gamma/tau
VEGSSAQIDWGVLLAQLNVQGMAKELAKHCTLENFVDGRLTLNLAPQHKHLQTNKMALDKLQAALTEYFAQPVRLLVTLGAANAATPAAVEQHEKQTRQQQATEAITQDPFVREVQAQLGAQVIDDSIKPI